MKVIDLKNVVIDIEDHALYRMIERGSQFGLSFQDVESRVWSTVRKAKLGRKHQSREYTTFYGYFKDNVSLYVICEKSEDAKEIRYQIKTVIIEEGRE